ncbi:IS110 family transposase [Adhaeribacter arboris]|uniref:IS110 family transposase n=1 Tax=Adhaeribacter arboris TaxID=2072846 RepID=A0A2T2YE89_9BACT|nr:transposase [Adhaeribacter arboris]PSR52112.1 IS110 family transposase [Adhaeribacter arboris]PSR53824.1 IS110 family transposase [Adhaeribacter arboris]
MEPPVLKQALGIDVAKDSLSLCLGTLTQDLEKQFIAGSDVSNDDKGFQRMEKWLVKLSVHPQKLVVVMEATGVYHEALAVYLHEKGYTVSVMQSGRVKRYAQSLSQRSKTDALDCRMLAMLGCERKLTPWSPPDKTLRHLKALSRERSFLLKEKNVEKNRLHAIETSAYSNPKEVKRQAKRLKLVEVQLQEIEAEMKDLVDGDAALGKKIQYLESIPGISFLSAATVVGETCGFKEITSAKQLASYAGYDVVLKESGTFRGSTKISKKGNSHLRSILHMPSMTAVRVNPTLKQFYNRLKPNKAKPIIALVAVQRKLLLLMYSLYKKNEYYNPQFEKKQQEPKPLLHRIEAI